MAFEPAFSVIVFSFPYLTFVPVASIVYIRRESSPEIIDNLPDYSVIPPYNDYGMRLFEQPHPIASNQLTIKIRLFYFTYSALFRKS
jgi:hypothetical protein